MKGKKIDISVLNTFLNEFLKDRNSILFGFRKNGDFVSHYIFKENAIDCVLINPTFSVNGAIYLGRVFQKNTNIILILRPCEIRAYVELTKLTQIERESTVAISVDCHGTLSLKNLDDIHSSVIPDDLKGYVDFSQKSDNIRYACENCSEKRGIFGDAGIRYDKSGNLFIVPYTERGFKLISSIDGELIDLPEEFSVSPEKDKHYDFKTDLNTLKKDLERCILCMNCRDVCPVCYCVDCLFNGDEYLPKGDALINKIMRVGSSVIPYGKELFHLIRMYHVSQTCVGCGACEEACPQNIPLTKYFKNVSERLQGLFSYMSGRDFGEPIPYTTFLEDELKDAAD